MIPTAASSSTGRNPEVEDEWWDKDRWSEYNKQREYNKPYSNAASSSGRNPEGEEQCGDQTPTTGACWYFRENGYCSKGNGCPYSHIWYDASVGHDVDVRDSKSSKSPPWKSKRF